VPSNETHEQIIAGIWIAVVAVLGIASAVWFYVFAQHDQPVPMALCAVLTCWCVGALAYKGHQCARRAAG
jgi:hypothetical protein